MTDSLARAPSLVSLRVLLALAERGSTVAAAEAANLSQSAVSKQLGKLEETVGHRLFVRHPMGMRLSEAGEIYVRQARVALKAMEDAALEVARLSGDENVLRLHTLPIFGDRWLLPRFGAFAERYPEVDVQFTSFRTAGQAEPDAAFRYGAPPFAGESADYIIGTRVSLYGAPAYLERIGAGAGGLDWLRAATILEHPGTPNRWSDLVASGTLAADAPGPRHIVEFGFFTLVIRAAIAGQGLALIPDDLLRAEERGVMLAPAGGLGFESPNAYWFTCPADRPQRRALRLFRQWLLAEVAAGF
ncbi:LysR family transcriptional regulator [Aureimonas mangrovi]|uniref:LysR family transcriptional regulator n=1 Tax=Aureimonas mangrovi TaxID=2758041 RepID=UPI00163DDCF4|nr:LysR family transcriptional regulator [Aureimonas mangrovi]